MPTLNQMKTRLYSNYPSKRWKKRIDGMSDSQIIAIWYSLQKRKQKNIPISDSPDLHEVQLPLFTDL